MALLVFAGLRSGAGGTGGDSGQVTRQAARISGGVMAGYTASRVDPVHPEDAKARGVSGAVVLHAIVGRDGAVENLTVISGPEIIAECGS